MFDLTNYIDFQLVILIISFGEVAKKLIGSSRINKFWKVFLISTPFAILYLRLSGIEITRFLTSYFFSFWVYEAIMKFILNEIRNGFGK